MLSLLQRNALALERATDAKLRARLLAQRAALLARHWRRAEVDEALERAAHAVEGCADPEAVAELELARALVQYYGGSPSEALRHARRALGAAGALRLDGLVAECHAWAGSIASTLREPPETVLQHLRHAVEGGLRHRTAAAARAYYAAGALWQEAGLTGTAVAHYRRAKQLARQAEDEQLVAAVSRYMTLLQVTQARRAHADGQLDAAQRRQVIADLGTAAELARALAGDEMGVQGALHLGEMRRLEGDDAGAITLFERHLPEGVAQGLAWEAVIAQADYALCLARAGRREEARVQAAQAERAIGSAFDGYTRAVVWSTLAELAAHEGRALLAAEREARSREAWAEDAGYRARLRASLEAQPLPG
jgi:hypothetical protein